jgi:hypothetical protein
MTGNSNQFTWSQLVMPIESLSPSARDYLAAFDLAAVAISPTGRVFISKNPTGASAAFWCRAGEADKVANAAWHKGDIAEAARRLHIAVTPHPILVARIATRTKRIDEALARAKADGLMQQFHRAYKERRLKAKAHGAPFMSFGEAERRLRKLIADSIAAGGTIPQSFTEVFDR